MSGSRRETLQDFQEWSGGPPGYPGVVERPHGCPGVVRRHSQMSGSGRETVLGGQEAIPDVQQWS